MKQNCNNAGRGVIVMRPFTKGEIVVDYHAKEISTQEAEAIMNTDDDEDRRSDYLFVIPGHGMVLDGSSETCVCHPHSIVLGRLLNFATSSSKSCNISPHIMTFPVPTEQGKRNRDSNKLFRVMVFCARRDIETFEEIRFDYGDETCLKLFSAAGSQNVPV